MHYDRIVGPTKEQVEDQDMLIVDCVVNTWLPHEDVEMLATSRFTNPIELAKPLTGSQIEREYGGHNSLAATRRNI